MIKSTKEALQKTPKSYWQNWKQALSDTLQKGKVVIAVLSMIAILAGLRWLGLKGIIGMLIGMLIMAIVILSKNPLAAWILSKCRGEEYVKDITK